MADSQSNSRLFSPSYNTVKEKDSMLVQAPIEYAGHAARKSQTGMAWKNDSMKVSHIQNRR